MTAKDKFTDLGYDYKITPPITFFKKSTIIASKVATVMDTPVGIEIHFITPNNSNSPLIAIFPINKPESIGYINLNADEIDAIYTQIQEIKNA